MKNNDKTNVCPVELAGPLDSRFRRWLHNPNKILKPYIREGMTVLDIGCGPGLFSLEIAMLLNGKGQVIAADLQEGMLKIIRKKVKATPLEHLITLQQCKTDTINVTDQVDFILAFYMVHEVPDQGRLLSEFKSILKPGGRILIVEPKFHVNQKAFEIMLRLSEDLGFRVIERPKVRISRSVVLGING